jgi:hypothetical protein
MVNRIVQVSTVVFKGEDIPLRAKSTGPEAEQRHDHQGDHEQRQQRQGRRSH